VKPGHKKGHEYFNSELTAYKGQSSHEEKTHTRQLRWSLARECVRKNCANTSTGRSDQKQRRATINKPSIESRVFETTLISAKGKSTESMCNKTVVDHITQFPVDNTSIQRYYQSTYRAEYVNYYIASLAELKAANIQHSLKIGSPNSSVGTNPSTVILLGAILLSRTCVPKFISTICTGHSHPMSIALWNWMHMVVIMRYL
jgi:hypothetical protein